MVCVALAFAAAGTAGAEPAHDPFKEGMAARSANNVPLAVSLLSSVAEDDPHFAEAMIVAGRDLLTERENEPDAGRALVERAWRKFPDRQETTFALLHCELLAGTRLTVPPVVRPYANRVPEELRFIATPRNWPDHSHTCSRAELGADLAELEILIANAYSYADQKGADWRGALDAVRSTLEDETPIDTFAWRLRRAFTLFGDPHSTIRSSLENFIPRSVSPFLAVPQDQRVLALLPDRTAFLDADCRYIERIDGLPIAKWLEVASLDVARASPQNQWERTVGALRELAYLRAQLDLPASPNITLGLGSEDGQRHKDLTLEIPALPPHVSGWPRTRTELRENIGILRIAEMESTPAFLKDLNDSMAKFRETAGLIIDVRKNGGGSQDALTTLLPYFMPPEAPIKIVNVAAYRIPARLDHVPSEGYLPTYRQLFPVTSSHWSAPQRAEIETFLAHFKPDWKLPPGFSGWHVMAISHRTNPKAFYYPHPVVILCDAGCVSATDNFLSAFKGYPNVTLLGTTSTGASGRMEKYTLRHSGISLTLCQMASFRATGELLEGRGVPPDVVLEPLPADHLKREDSVLEAALQRLRRG